MQSFKKLRIFNKNALVEVIDFPSDTAFKNTLLSIVVISSVTLKVDPLSCCDLSWGKKKKKNHFVVFSCRVSYRKFKIYQFTLKRLGFGFFLVFFPLF